jgi:hypothetical protein
MVTSPTRHLLMRYLHIVGEVRTEDWLRNAA